MPKSSAAPNAEILQAALQGLEVQRQKIEEQISHVRSIMGKRVGRPPKKGGGGGTAAKTSAASSGTTRKKRVLSAEARKRIAAAQKKRWAAFRKSQG
jgi:hypothetical protein